MQEQRLKTAGEQQYVGLKKAWVGNRIWCDFFYWF